MSKQFNYILNDLALLSLAARCLYSESATHRDRETLYEQLQLLIAENTKLRHWDYNKDTRNSRQRVANKRMSKTLEEYKEFLRVIYKSIDNVLNTASCELNLLMLRDDIKKFIGDDLIKREERCKNGEDIRNN